jgi:competence protein ComEC
MRKSVRVKGIVILALFVLVLCIWYAAWREDARGRLTVSFLNVGQGDAVYIEAPSGRQVLIDGGQGGSVLRALGSVMAPWDRSLDVVIATSADQDDVSGLIDVLQRYTVDTIIQSGVENSTPVWNLFEKEAAATKIITARRGQIVDLGKGAYLEILSPDRPVPGVSSAEGCVVARLVYGKTAFMLPCDAPQGVENYLAMLDGISLKSDVLLAGHNGAKTSSSPIFVGYVAPQYAVYSRGCDSKFTPNAATVSTFAKFNVQTLDTCADGTITFVSDGQTVARK